MYCKHVDKKNETLAASLVSCNIKKVLFFDQPQKDENNRIVPPTLHHYKSKCKFPVFTLWNFTLQIFQYLLILHV